MIKFNFSQTNFFSFFLFPFFFLFIFSTSLNALELSMQAGKENKQKFSTLHLKHDKPFLCEEQIDDFGMYVEVICAFEHQPIKVFKKLDNDFFDIRTQIKDMNYFIIIRPRKKMKLYAQIFDFKVDKTLFKADTQRSKEWLMVGYNDSIPFLEDASRSNQKVSETSINFPITFVKKELPFVGGLDLKGNPITLGDVEDVSEYMKIKNHYEQKQYNRALALIDEVIEEYPDTMFMSELILYQIRTLHELEEYENVIDVAKIFMRLYSSDDHMAEVLLKVSHSYSKIGLFIDADYFYDRLFNEHKNTDYVYKGLIYKGEQLQSSGDNTKAIKFYTQALYNTANLEIASMAAYRLAQVYLEKADKKGAKKNIDIILKGNPDYFYRHITPSVSMMRAMTDFQDYDTAANIAAAILLEMTPGHDIYEDTLKSYAYFLADADRNDEAVLALNRYLEEFKYGTYSDEIQEKKDSLFFEKGDENSSVKLAQYNQLIEQYRGDSIANQALYKKAKLYLEDKEFKNVLELRFELRALNQDEFNDIEFIVNSAATAIMQKALNERKCMKVVTLSNEYNVTLTREFDSGLFECSRSSGNFSFAKEIAQPYLKDSDMLTRLIWLDRYARVDFETGNYLDAIKASKEVLTLSKTLNQKKFTSIIRILFDSYQRQNSEEKMIETAKILENNFGVVFEDIERYTQLLTLGVRRKDNTIIINNASKVVMLQEKSKTHTQSPYIEFTLAKAYHDNNNITKAIEILHYLDAQSLKPKKRSRKSYLLGSYYQKNKENNKAKEAYEDSIREDENSAWAKLSKDALEFL
jgi:hypothetical protein